MMHLQRKDNNETIKFPLKEQVMVGNDFDCDIQINHPDLHGKHFIVKNKGYGCVLEVFEGVVFLEQQKVMKQCMIEPGETIGVGELCLTLIDDEFIPKDSAINHTQIDIKKNTKQSAVFGLRSFDRSDAGHFIINDFHHKEGWHVIRQDNDLHFIDSKHKTRLNGLKVAQAKLSNGDVITGPNYKYKVELPGTSGYSKFSPSHPKNVMLSEQVSKEPSNKPNTQSNQFIKNNLWWMTLLVGLLLLLILIINNNQ